MEFATVERKEKQVAAVVRVPDADAKKLPGMLALGLKSFASVRKKASSQNNLKQIALASLPSLQEVSVDFRNASDPKLVGWIATLPKLECLDHIPPIAPLDYQKFNDHPSLARTTIHIAKDQTQWPFEELRLPALRELIVRCGDNVSAHALDGIASFAKLEALVRFAGALVEGNDLGLEVEFSSLALVSASIQCGADHSPFLPWNERSCKVGFCLATR